MNPRDCVKLNSHVTPALDLLWTSVMSPRVHRSPLDALNLSRYNSLIKWLRFKSFEIRIVVQSEVVDDRWFKFNARSSAPRAATSSIAIDC